MAENDTDRLREALEVVSVGLSGAAAGTALSVDPQSASLALGAVVAQFGALVAKRRRKRARSVAEGAAEVLGDEAPSAALRVLEDEDLAALAYQTVDASMLSHHEEQARALGRVLGEALKAEPTVTIDEAAMVIEALRFLDLPHLRALALFPSSRPDPLLLTKISDQLDGADDATVSGIIGGLQRSTLIEVLFPNPVEQVERAQRGFTAVENAGWAVSAFGKRVLSYIE